MPPLVAIFAAAGLLAAFIFNKVQHPHQITPGLPLLSPADEHRLTGSSRVVKLINPQGVETLVRTWEAAESVEASETKAATVVLVHGFSWHSQYFSKLAAALQSAGFRVVAYDLQGHGRSGQISAAKAYATRFDDWVKELGQVVRESCPIEQKLFLFAESMGATIVLRALTGAAADFGAVERVDGVIFSGPVIRVAPEVLPPPPVVAVIKALATVFPLLSVPTSEVADGFESAFGDAAFAAEAKKDPLVIFDNPRLRSAAEILATVDHNIRSFALVKQPLLVLHGAEDKRTHASNSRDFINGVSSKDKKLVIIPGGNHQLLQDKSSITEDVIGQIIEFFSHRAL